MLFVLLKPFFPVQVLFVPVVYSGVLPVGHPEEEDGTELAGEWALRGDPLVTFDCGGTCFVIFWVSKPCQWKVVV